MDLCGSQSLDIRGFRYFLVIIDDFTRYGWLILLKAKSEVTAKFTNWKGTTEKQTGHVVRTIRSDRGGEFDSTDLNRYLMKQGIRKETTMPRTPQQNGVAERMMRTIKETVKAMLIDAQMPEGFWGLAALHAMWLRNRLPTQSLTSRKTPYEELFGKKPSLSDTCAFGSTCFMHIPEEDRTGGGNRTPHGRKGRFVGHSDQSKGWKIWLSEPGTKIVESRDVKFWEEGDITIPLSNSSPSSDRSFIRQKELKDESEDESSGSDSDDESEDDDEAVGRTPVRSRTSINKSGGDESEEDDSWSQASFRPSAYEKDDWEEHKNDPEWDSDSDRDQSTFEDYRRSKDRKNQEWLKRYPAKLRVNDKEKGEFAFKKDAISIQAPRTSIEPVPEITVTQDEPESSGRPKRQTRLPGHLEDYDLSGR